MYLDHKLCDITHIARENYESFKEHLARTGTYQAKVTEPVFVTVEERMYYESIESKTKAHIIEEIQKIMLTDKQIPTVAIKKNMKKAQLVVMYYEMREQMEANEILALVAACAGEENEGITNDIDV